MRIEKVELIRVPLSALRSDTGAPLESVVVSLHSGEHTGWGEATLGLGPLECEEWSAGAFACLQQWILPAVLGRQIDSSRALEEVLSTFRGNHRARSALDAAWWDLLAVSQQKPLYQVLGGRRTVVPLACTIQPSDSPDELLRSIGESYERGCELVVLKFRPNDGLEMVRAVRQRFAAQSLAIDCEGGCTLAQQDMFYRLDDFFLHHIEQPLPADDLVGHAMLQQSLRTSISLSESITSLERAEQAIDMGSCRLVRLSPARLGGLTAAIAVADHCREAEIPCAIDYAPQGALAACASASLAMLPNCSQPAAPLAFARAEPWIRFGENLWTATTATGKPGFSPPAEVAGEGVAGLGVAVDVGMLAVSEIERAKFDWRA